MLLVQFSSMNVLFHVIIRKNRIHVFMQNYRYSEIFCNRHTVAFLDTSVLREVPIFCPLSPQ